MIGQERREDLRAIEWRNRHEVENGKHEVNEDNILERLPHLGVYGNGSHNPRENARDKQVACRPRPCNKSPTAFRVLQVIGIIRYGLCPTDDYGLYAEEERERKHEREDYGPERVNVAYGIHREPAHAVGGFVPQPVRHRPVRNFVHDNRNDEHRELEDNYGHGMNIILRKSFRERRTIIILAACRGLRLCRPLRRMRGGR